MTARKIRHLHLVGLSILLLSSVSCKSNVESGARSVDAMMLTYYEALSTKNVKLFATLLPDPDLSWGVYNDADRADEKVFRQKHLEKANRLEAEFKKHAEEFGGVKVSVTSFEAEPEQQLEVVWSAEPYGRIPAINVTAFRDGKQYKYLFSNVMQYRGKYYLEESPFVDIKHWE